MVPVNALKQAEGGPAASQGALGEVPPPCPVVDSKEDADVQVNMRKVIPYVTGHLRQILRTRADLKRQFADTPPHLHQPLLVKAVEQLKDDDLTSYKPPWSSDDAVTSLHSTGMYEASGNILWCSPHPEQRGDAQVIAGDPPTWPQVEEFAEAHFSAEAFQESDTTAGKARRITFPTPLVVHVARVEDARHASFASTLPVLSGHVYIYAWYWSMFKAINAEQDCTLLAALWQAGLTVTLHCRVGMSMNAQAILSIALSETRKAQARLQSDSFMAFAYKALLALRDTPMTDKVKAFTNTGVRFNGSAVSKAMLSGILIFEDKVTERAAETLRSIERKFGREVLTAGYGKLVRVSGLCTSHAAGMHEKAEELLEYVLEYIRWSLKFEYVTPKDVTTEYLDKARDGTVGVVPIALARKRIVSLISGWIDALQGVPAAESLASELCKVLYHFASYVRLEASFDQASNSGGPAASRGCAADDAMAEVDADPVAEQDADPVDRMKKTMYRNKTSHALIDFLYDLLSCSHDKEIAQVLKTTAVKDIQWLDVEALHPLRDLQRLFNVHKTVIDTTSSGPPPAGSRALQRYSSEADEEPGRKEELRKERADAWRQAQAHRKKLVHVGVCKAATKQQLQQHFEKTPVYAFTGKPAEAHRVFVFSSELFVESRQSPWATPVEWTKLADTWVEWALTQAAPSDVLMFADGRSRQCRRAIERLCDKARNQHEAWIVYRPTRRLGRRVAFAADNKEMVLVSMPLARTQVATTPRTHYNQAGEDSTHETTYTGVEPAPWGSLPLMLASDKEKVVGHAPEVPKSAVFDTGMGVPLYWQERKTVTCWKALLGDVQAKAVYDLTPGSGACARAAMQLGATYACVTRNAEHGSWLQNIVDRQALRSICEAGHPLHQQDLAQCVHDHFEDILDQLNQQDAAVDTEPAAQVDTEPAVQDSS